MRLWSLQPKHLDLPDPHSIFRVVPGPGEGWEKSRTIDRP